MHTRPPHHPGSPIWLLSGTGEGPPLAKTLLARGWRLRVWVVSEGAARSYPAAPGLELAVGPIGGSKAVANALARAEAAGDRPAWVVDATHPFARRISADLAEACRLRCGRGWRFEARALAWRCTLGHARDGVRTRPR